MTEHFWKSLPGWFTFPDFYAHAAAHVPLVGARIVEVGSFYGQSAAFLAVELINRGCVGAKIDLVDLGDFAEVYAKNLAPVAEAIGTFHRVASWDAADLYEDGSLDFVFIDAAHEYAEVKKDLAAWRRKVKRGGLLGGHDYTAFFPGLQRAVNEAFDRFEVWRGFESRLSEPESFPVQHWPCWAVTMDGKGERLIGGTL